MSENEKLERKIKNIKEKFESCRQQLRRLEEVNRQLLSANESLIAANNRSGITNSQLSQALEAVQESARNSRIIEKELLGKIMRDKGLDVGLKNSRIISFADDNYCFLFLRTRAKS